MNFFDSSALLKLLFDERESDGLADWVSARASVPAVTSELARVEVIRATRRLDTHVLSAARALVAQLDLVPLSSDLLESATDVGTDALRSLDAINLVSAVSLGPALEAFVAYDTGLITAARDIGLPTVSPQ